MILPAWAAFVRQVPATSHFYARAYHRRMNLLAHLLLADRHELSLTGSLLEDFVKGTIEGRFNPALREAIRIHRRIDAFTDEHPLFRDSCRRIAPLRRRYAPVFVDVFYDHLLSRHWESFARSERTRDREIFIAHVYRVIDSERDHLPERIARLMRYMIDHDLLGSYAQIEGVDEALHRLSLRVRRPQGFADAASDLLAHFEHFEQDFLAFFPELERFVAREVVRKRT